jgi:hypothetical protein
MVHGDRCIHVQMNDSDHLLVPLECGATGNCSWLLVAGPPWTTIGSFWAHVIYLQEAQSGYPRIRTLTTSGYDSAIVQEFSFQEGTYVRDSKEDLDARGIETFLKENGTPRCDP